MDKILRINVGTPGAPGTEVEELGRYRTLGGRGMTSTVIWEEVEPGCDRLGPENKLVIAPGIMSGSMGTTSGRMSIGFKSPLTGGIKESNVGGQGSQYLAKLGYAAVVIEGERLDDTLYQVVINNSGVTITPCNEYRMLGNYDLVDRIKESFGDKVAVISIGQAGEQFLANSTISVTDTDFRPTRHAGRGGGGAVMGSKGIKAIIIDAAGAPMRQPADAEAFKNANRKLMDTVRSSSYTGQGLPSFGTAMVGELTNEMGAFPALGSRKGNWENIEKISGSSLSALENERGGEGAATHGCHKGCMVRCSGTFRDKESKFVTKQPEYETLWAHGGYCGIDDLDAIAQLDRMDDDFGLDTIEMGCTIGMLIEAGELETGDVEGALAAVAEIGKGTERGKLLGSGTARVAEHYGVKRAPVVKGQAMAAYDPRALKGMGVTYATSPMGADHTAGNTLANHLHKAIPHVDALAKDNQWLASAIAQISAAAFDSTGFCLFMAFASLDKPETVKYILDTMSAFTGVNWNENNFGALGMRVLRMELDFNRRAGLTEKDDKLPEWMLEEPLPPHNHVFDVPEEDLRRVHNHTDVVLTMYEGVTMAFAPPMALMNEGTHRLVPDNLAALGVTKALIVTDRGVAQVGLLKMLTDAMDAKFMPYAVYDGTEPNPTSHNVADGLAIYHKENCDGLVSLGGGSPHDCAKVIGILATNPGTPHDYEGLFGVTNMLPPVIAVTTTSGTGSEGSIAAVITDPERHHKMVIADPKLLPIVAVNDPLLTRTMPPHITAGTGMDALTHAIEAFTSKLANPFSDGLALQAIKLVAENLPKAVENGDDMEARNNMCYGQYCAGIAMNSAQLGNTHSLAHSLGAVYNLPHGDCNALMLPYVMHKNKASNPAKFAEVARAMQVDTTGMSDEQAADAAVEAVEALVRKVGILPSVTALAERYQKATKKDDIEGLVVHALHDLCNAANPIIYKPEDYREIYEAAWE
jgi:aldehyde:ferredoxin oxidoreductase